MQVPLVQTEVAGSQAAPVTRTAASHLSLTLRTGGLTHLLLMHANPALEEQTLPPTTPPKLIGTQAAFSVVVKAVQVPVAAVEEEPTQTNPGTH